MSLALNLDTNKCESRTKSRYQQGPTIDAVHVAAAQPLHDQLCEAETLVLLYEQNKQVHSEFQRVVQSQRVESAGVQSQRVGKCWLDDQRARKREAGREPQASMVGMTIKQYQGRQTGVHTCDTAV